MSVVKEVSDVIKGVPGFVEGMTRLLRRRKTKKRLREALSGEYEWRNLDTLARQVGLSPEATREVLVEINARPSLATNDPREKWGLISRVGPA